MLPRDHVAASNRNKPRFPRNLALWPGLRLRRPCEVGLPVFPSQNPSVRNLANRRILVAEDEGLIALDLEATLQGFGCQVVGPL